MKISLIVLLCALTTNISAQHGPVFPQPSKMEQTTDKWVFNGRLILEDNPDIKEIFPYLKNLFAKNQVQLELSSGKDATVRLQKINTFVYTEGYQLNVTTAGIEIQYSNTESLLNAFHTLSQLVQDPKELAGVRISDEPAFGYRGVHLDCSRHFFTIEELKGFIDQIARLKFNKFHWHLTDDQGWRIEIKKYPKLTSVGAWRDSTLIGHFSKQPIEYEHQRYGGFYTQEEAKELVRYAGIRGIQVIPEIAGNHVGRDGQHLNVNLHVGLFATQPAPGDIALAGAVGDRHIHHAFKLFAHGVERSRQTAVFWAQQVGIG